MKIEITPPQLDTLCAGLGVLKKRIAGRIKCNSKDPKPRAAKHLEHNTERLKEIEALLEIMKSV